MLRRPRRLRINSATRNLVRETKLNIEDLIYPLFIVEGENIKREISSLPDVYHFSLDMLEEEIKEIKDLGIKVSLDDFGSGYSSLTILKNLPIDTIKLDN